MEISSTRTDSPQWSSTIAPGFRAACIKIGNVCFSDVHVADQAGAFALIQVINAAVDKTRRVRGARSRYVEPLPPSAPPRIISIETTDYLRNLENSGIEQGTMTSKRFCFRLLKLACGDIPVSQITASHITEFWEVHRWWPRKARSAKRFRGLTDEEILAIGKRENTPPRKRGSITAALADLSAFFNHLVRSKTLSHSPVDPNFVLKDDLIGPDARRSLTKEEIASIFEPTNFLPWASRAPHHWWGAMLGLFTGARVNELAQLKVSDVIQHQGRWALHLRKTVDADLAGNVRKRSRQKFKGKSSLRIIPLAQPLLDAGFLDYVADIKETRHPRLFPHLSCGVNRTTGELNGSGYGRGLSKAFSEYLHSILDLPKGFSFHLFRHTFASGLRASNTNKLLIATLTGHVPRALAEALEVYIHEQEDQLLNQQLAALAKFHPPVKLPVYVRGQFARELGRGAKFHP
jgi:integrase